jgi:O-antigen/teichoic acid export membrane protein
VTTAARAGEEPLRPEWPRLAGDAGWLAAAGLSQAVAVLVGMRLLTEYLPPATFGTVTLLTGWMTLAMGTVAFPVLQAVLRFHPEAAAAARRPELRASARHLLVRVLPIAAVVVVAVGLWFTGASLASWIALALLVLLGFVEAARGLELNLLTASRRQAVYAGWTATEGWARPLLAVGLVVALGPTAVNVIGAYLLASVVVLLVFTRSFVRKESGPFPRDARMASEMVQYGLPLLPLAIVSWVLALSDRYIVAGLRGVGEAGLYAAAYGLMNRPFMMAFGTLETTLRPVFFEAVVHDDREQERRIFRLWVATVAAVCGLMLIVVIALRQLIAALTLGPAYREAAELFPLIAFGSFLQALGCCWQARLFALKRTKEIALVQSAGALAAVTATYLLVSAMGIRGAALACPIYFGLSAVLMISLAERAQARRRSIESQPMATP